MGTFTRPGGLPRGLAILLGGAALVIIVAGIQATAWLIGPAFMALIIVIAVAPVQGWMRRRGWPPWLGALVVILLVYAILLGLALGIIFSVARLATELPQYATKADSLVASATKQLAALGVGPEQLQQAAGSLNLGKLAAVLGALLASVAGLASNFVFLMALLLFVSVESGGYHHRLASIAADRPQISEALGHFAWGTRQHLLVTTIPLTLLAKGLLVDVDPRAKCADALLRASAEEPDPTAPKKRKRRGRHTDESDDHEVPDREPVVDLSATPT